MSSAVPVEVVCTSGPVPFVAQGRVFEVTVGRYVIDLDQDASKLPAGARAIVSFIGGDAARIIGRVVDVRGNRMVVSQDGVRNKERRTFPRLHGGIPMRYRKLGPGDHDFEVAGFLRGESGPAERGDWITPGEFMNFSVTGLKFDPPTLLEVDDLVLVVLGVRGREGSWRCTARVVAVEPSERGFGSAAIEFEAIPDAAQEALSALTLQIQDALLD